MTSSVQTNGHQGNVDRPHPQITFKDTTIKSDSFYGKLRKTYSEKVLKTQLEQLKKQGSYDAFDLKWHPAYDINRLTGGNPPSLFWESDVGKWIEAVCYFLNSPDGSSCSHKAEFDKCVQELVDKIEKAQQKDGYLNIYFTVVDPEGRYKNFRDMHEMYNSGHLLEGALAHYQYTGSRQFLDAMIKNIDSWIREVGPNKGQMHAYPGHPELELAVLRLASLTKDPKHQEFGHYLLSERGQKRADLDNKQYFSDSSYRLAHEAKWKRADDIPQHRYHQAHLPLHEQNDILGHSVRAMYLTTGAADLGGSFLDDAKRLFDDAVDNKMYVIGGFGSEPRHEGFHIAKHRLPNSTSEGGMYAETCAAIAAMMTSERILSHQLDGRYRDVMELALLNAVLGGGSLDGKQFAYANKLQTWGDEVATRKDWFTVCCCPPNLSRTLGILGGYTWNTKLDETAKTIKLDIYLFVSAEKTVDLPGGGKAKVNMSTEMPWKGKVDVTTEAPEGWAWEIRIPTPEYAENVKFSTQTSATVAGYALVNAGPSTSILTTFDLPIRLLANHPLETTDTLTVSRGPIIYTAESFDNSALEGQYTHFDGLGIKSNTQFEEFPMEIEGIEMIGLRTKGNDVYAIEEVTTEIPFRAVTSKSPARTWKKLNEGLTVVPWFARANRGGAGHVRTSFIRADEA
uniref:Uncharacterized protein n=1 Tax=Kwoniella dejecticola CBS 10117 TaxID=1296121 RepID=A0A1A5ZUT1_9TREE|nr:uncharacterized protein I303_08330 [Kwoniella dejecticola CBS 10117]OBR81560.1 hypothetical protein I303_08330 [Kwoniella dejecticola CBS 10117]